MVPFNGGAWSAPDSSKAEADATPDSRSRAEPLAARCVPIIRLCTQHFTVNRGDALRPRYEDVELPVIVLSFDYGACIVEADELELELAPGAGSGVLRDRSMERAARLALESFGAIDLDCLDSHGRDLDARADYLVSLDEDASAYCAFTASALPELTRRGYRVELDPAYPYRLIQGDLEWYAEVARDGERPDWFGLELGVQIDGQRVNLVPVLLTLLDRSAELSSLRALERGTEKLLVVPVASYGYARVSPDWLKRVWSVLVELYKEGAAKLPPGARELTRGHALKALDEAFANTGTKLHWQSEPEPSTAATLAFLEPPTPIDPARITVRASLRPYQLEGVAFLQHLRRHGQGGVLADDMGLGKTLQTIAHLALEHGGNALCPPSLIVCPTSLVYNWQRELARFAPQLRVRVYHGQARHREREWLDAADVILTSYPILLRDANVLEPLRYHLLVLDEAQAIKNSGSAVHRAVRALRAGHRLCLSGTPIENHLAELWSLFDFLSPGMLGSEGQFRARFPSQLGDSLVDEARLRALSERVAPFILRRMKEQVAKDLPGKIVSVVPVELSGKQRELYESIRAAAHHDVRQAIRHKGAAGATLDVLDALLKLRQLCCDPRLLKLPAARFVRESAKLARLLQLLEAHLECGRRVLVFSQFTGMLSLIAEALDERRIAHLSLTGATQNRAARVDAFTRGQADVFLISLKAGGTGLNLVSADTVIHYDPWWNPAAQDQATDRAYRIGQDKPVLVQELLAVGSVEERMRVLCEQKRALAQAILHGQGEAAIANPQIVDDLLAPLAD
jgi:superfamily II DNA or RNA helicase